MFCEVFFFRSSKKSYERILEKINEKSESCQIVTNRTGLEELLRKNGEKVTMVDDLIPSSGNTGLEVYKKSKKNLEFYQKIFKDLKFKNIKIFSGFDYKFLAMNIFLTKILMILEKKENVIFIFEGYNPVYLVILQNAKKLGYKCNNWINLLNKNNITKIKNDEKSSGYKNSFSINHSVNYIRLSMVDKPLQEKIYTIMNYSKKIISLGIKKIFQKFSLSSEENNIEKILNRIDKKKKNHKTENPECIFFSTAAREDLYLKPWYSIYEKFKNENKQFLIITSDIATELILSRNNVSYFSIFEEVKLLQEIIPNTNQGNHIRLFLEEKIEKNNSVVGFVELFDDILKKCYRTIAIFTILNHILKNSRVKSVVASSSGEILENSAVAIAKKFNIPTYSMLTVNVNPPDPWFSDWFKVDNIFVNGLNEKIVLEKLGYKNEKIVVVGNPKFDKYYNVDSDDAKIIVDEKYQINRKKKLILIAMSIWHKNDEVWMSNLIRFCAKNNLEIVIKVHPKYEFASNEINKEKISEIEKRCKGLKFLITYNLDLYTLLSASDLVISEYSNVGIESIIFNKILLTVNFTNERFEDDPLDLAKTEGAAIFVDNYNKLEKLISEILFEKKYIKTLDEARKNIMKFYDFYNDGNASNRIFEMLMKSK